MADANLVSLMQLSCSIALSLIFSITSGQSAFALRLEEEMLHKAEGTRLGPVQREAQALVKKAIFCNSILESEEAVKLANQAIGLDPNFAPAYFARAEAYCGLELLPKAIADLTLVSKQKAFKLPALRERARLYLANRNYEAALADMNQIMPALGTDGAYCQRARIYTALHKPALAAEDYSEALTKKQNNCRILTERAKCYLDSNQLAKALADYNYLIASDEKNSAGMANVQLYRDRARVFQLLNKPALAAQDEQKANAKEKTTFSNSPFRSGVRPK